MLHRCGNLRPSRRLWTICLTGAAIGLSIRLLIFGVNHLPPTLSTLSPLPPSLLVKHECPTHSDTTLMDEYIRPGSGQFIASEDERDLEDLKAMVAKTKGYFVRDWPLSLGWNNMRYGIEAAALHARLLGRTLVLPSFVYARTCEFGVQVCGAYVEMVNRADALHLDEWHKLPLVQQLGFKIPIAIMLDLNVLQTFVPVITTAQFLLLHNQPPTLETTHGNWTHDLYQPPNNPISLFTIPNDFSDPSMKFEPHGYVRVDRLPLERLNLQNRNSNSSSYPLPLRRSTPEPGTHAHEVYERLMENIPSFMTKHYDYVPAVRPDEALRWLNSVGVRPRTYPWTPEQLIPAMDEFGFGMLYSYHDRRVNPQKTVATHSWEFAPYSRMRGLVDDYADRTESVIHLPSEVHDRKRPGFLRFTDPVARDDFTTLVLKGVVHHTVFDVMADRIAKTMFRLNNGRMWMAAHMRRTDFVGSRFNRVSDVRENVDRIVNLFRVNARPTLRAVQRDLLLEQPHLAPLPCVTPDSSFVDKRLPLPNDIWFLATDDRSPKSLAYARSKGALTIEDLVDPSFAHLSYALPPLSETDINPTPNTANLTTESLNLDSKLDKIHYRAEDWPLLVTDVLGILEQAVMARAAFFTGHWMSSFAGGVTNLRGARGMDVRTSVPHGPAWPWD